MCLWVNKALAGTRFFLASRPWLWFDEEKYQAALILHTALETSRFERPIIWHTVYVFEGLRVGVGIFFFCATF